MLEFLGTKINKGKCLLDSSKLQYWNKFLKIIKNSEGSLVNRFVMQYRLDNITQLLKKKTIIFRIHPSSCLWS